MTTSQLSTNSGCGHIPEPRSRSAGSKILGLLRQRHERAELRRELEGLPEFVLQDIGITEGDVYQEIRKPFRRQ